MDIIDVNNSLIYKPKILRVTLKRLVTSNGFGKILSRDRMYCVGGSLLIDITSLREMHFTNKETGEVIKMPVVNQVDINGKDLGWIYAELFFL